MLWINRRAKFPYVSEDTWITRYWLLTRKVDTQGGSPTTRDLDMARILIHLSDAGRCKPPRHLVANLEWMYENGKITFVCPCTKCTPAEEDLGS